MRRFVRFVCWFGMIYWPIAAAIVVIPVGEDWHPAILLTLPLYGMLTWISWYAARSLKPEAR
jgi:hypothetical protein